MEWIFLAQNRDKFWGSCEHSNEPSGFIEHGKLFCVKNISFRRGWYIRNAPSSLRQFLTPQVTFSLSPGVLRSQRGIQIQQLANEGSS